MAAPSAASSAGGGEPQPGLPPPAAPAGSSWARLAGIAVVLLLGGAALGRFVLFAPPEQAAAERPAPADTVATLERLTAQRPDDPAAWQSLGTAYTGRAAETGDPAFYELAERAFSRADALEPDALGTLVGRGALALSLHDFPTALVLGQQALELAPGNADALGVVVDAHVELGRYGDATDTLQRLLDRNPALPALARTSYLRELNGDLVGAGRAMQQALVAAQSAGAHDLALVQALLADLQLVRGDVEVAVRGYDEAAATLPTLVEASIGRARVAVARGDLDRALAVLEPVVDRIPRPDAVILYADLLRLDGRDEQAADADELVRTLTTLQSAGGQDVDLELALFEADRGEDPDGAVALARAAFESRPDNVFAADVLAWALHRAGRSAEALAHSEQALRLGTASPLLRTHAALIAAAAGQEAAAQAHLEALFSMSPWTVLPHRAEIADLAGELGTEVPAAWSSP